LTLTDFDIIFNKIKEKTERKITFGQFQEGLKLLAAKKYPSKPSLEAYSTLVSVIIKNGSPNLSSKATPTKLDAVSARLTDPTNFTGTQKTRLSITGSSPSLSKRGYNTVVTASAERLGSDYC
jgi:p25-alpha